MNPDQANTMAKRASVDIPLIAREAVVGYFNRNVRYRTDRRIFVEDTFVVWFCKTLQNWKALVGTTNTDSQYYEVTYDGVENQIYLDVYVKAENVVMKPGIDYYV